MGVFHRRYLCIFACGFLLASFGATMLAGIAKLWLASVLLLLAAIALLILLLCGKKRRFLFAVLLMCALFAFVGVANSFLFISLPQEKAARYEGMHALVARIDAVEYQGESSSKYNVSIMQIDDEALSIRASLDFDFPTELSVGDTVAAPAEIAINEYYGGSDKSLLLAVSVEDSEHTVYRTSEGAVGIKQAVNAVRSSFIDYIESIFSYEDAALLKGFLISDKSDISPKIINDFRRSGVSHLLSVSGFHIALLLGSLELLLRKIYVPKRIRCVLVMLFGVFFLALTNFSGSAVRSALMLFSVYASFLFSEDNDPLTSLLASVMLIVLVSPYSIYDIGLFMSFFATFGLLTVYPYIDSKLPKPSPRKFIARCSVKLCLWLVRTALVTVIANFFLLPVVWYFFGEISLTSIPSNLILSPISALYLPLSVVSLVVGKIPFVGSALTYIVSLLGRIIVGTAELFSGLKYSSVSLGYNFAALLVIAFAISSVALLVVKLKRKWLVCIPAFCFCVIFSVCVSVFSLTDKTELCYVNNQSNDYVLLQNAEQVAIIDTSKGQGTAIWLLDDYINPEATEIDSYVVTHAHKNHAYSIERTLQNAFIRKLYLPLCSDSTELLYIKDIYDRAKFYNVQIIFYNSGDVIELHSNMTVAPTFLESTEGCSRVHFQIFDGKNRECVLTYSDRKESEQAMRAGAESKYLLIGNHGGNTEQNIDYLPEVTDTTVIFASETTAQSSTAKFWSAPKYILNTKEHKSVKLPLD